jgi:trypsin
VWEDLGMRRGLPMGGRDNCACPRWSSIAASAVIVATACLAGSASSAATPETKRVVGGVPANPADWPYAAALMEDGSHICGATVIAPNAVLTAGHCVFFARPGKLRVVTGRPDLTDTGSGQRIRADRVFVHPGFRRHPSDHDVAVVTLRNDTIASPATLPTVKEATAETELGDALRVAGWGATKPGGWNASMTLMATTQYPIKPPPCKRAFPRFGFHRETQICTRGDQISEHRYTSSCYGDSGGPLIADAPTADLVVGVVSYGGPRCGVRNPSVYFRVSSALRFIREKAGL